MDILFELNLAQSGLNDLYTSHGSFQKIGLGDLLIALATGVAGDVSSFNGRSGIVTSQTGDYTTDMVTEASNLYFTNSRVLAAPLTGYVSGPGVITPSDTILSAIQKLNGNITYDTAESIHVDGTNSPTNNINWGGYGLSNAIIGANSLTISGLNGILLATSGLVSGSATTSNLPEGSNLYYTQARFNSAFAAKTTDDLTEGATNLYFTTAHFDTAFAGETTSNLAEGSNLYFTTARAQAAISATAPILYSSGVISMHVADAIHDGYLSSADWNTFDAASSEPLSLHIDGSNYPTADIDWGGYSITNLNSLLFEDGVGSIGQSGANRPLNIYASSTITAPFITATSSLTIANLSGILKATAGVVSGSSTTSDLPEGSNLYFTTARVLGTQLTGYVSGPGTITAADSILSAIQKLNGNITNDLAESLHIDGSNSPTANIDWGGYQLSDVALVANSVSIGALYGVLYATAGVVSGNATTDNLPEGVSNLYWTQTRFNNAFAAKNTDNLSEGVVNLYFTNARAIAAPLTGYVSAPGTITASDTILSAIEKLNGNNVGNDPAGVQYSIQTNDGSGNFAGDTYFLYDGNQANFNLVDSWGGLHVMGRSGGEASIALHPDNISNGAAGQWILATNGSSLSNPLDFAIYNAPVGIVLYIQQSTNNVGIGNTNPSQLLSVGTGFGVDTNGNLVNINGVSYSWPSSQGAANTVLQNDGSGNLSWTLGDSIVNTLTTTDATPTSIYSTSLPDSSVWYFEARVIANYSDGSAVEVFHKNVAATATVSSNPSLVSPGETTIFESDGAILSVDWIINGSSVELQVTGDPSISVNWKCFVNVYPQNN